MFTGIIQTTGTVHSLSSVEGGGRLSVTCDLGQLPGTGVGDSIAVQGVCLTVVALSETALTFDLLAETLRCTTLGRLAVGDLVNLEPALGATGLLGGHLLSGHVDGFGTVSNIEQQGPDHLLTIALDADLLRGVVAKGSIAIDGVSLTVAELTPEGLTTCLIPHTWAVTTLSRRQPGDPVNIETDMIGKYVQRYLDARSGAGEI